MGGVVVRYVIELPDHQGSHALGGQPGQVVRCLIFSPSKSFRPGWACKWLLSQAAPGVPLDCLGCAVLSLT